MKSLRSMLPVFLIAAAGLCVIVFFRNVIHTGSEIIAGQVRNKLKNEPKFSEPVGEVHEFSTDFLATVVQPEDVRVYRVKGTKWSGRVTVKQVTDNNGDEQIIWARFTLPSGKSVEINAP